MTRDRRLDAKHSGAHSEVRLEWELSRSFCVEAGTICRESWVERLRSHRCHAVAGDSWQAKGRVWIGTLQRDVTAGYTGKPVWKFWVSQVHASVSDVLRASHWHRQAG